jgi:putative radical SAM enzyme (TIGR03279 family)
MKINHVEKESIAASIGLKVGDRLEAIDGSRVKDIIDYRFKVTDENILLRVRQGGELKEYDIEKDADDTLGLGFDDFKIRGCANDCVFCFADQNPAGMRNGLYFRDGDFRMSFLHGHFITMTNMGWKELKRIVEQRLSPLYVSVHVTDPDKRLEMFLYGKDDFLMKKFEYLTENGIELHAQVVLCPGWNDGNFLEKTIADIHSFCPNALSMSVVPVGLTKHRDGLPNLPPVTAEYARSFIPIGMQLSTKYRQEDGQNFVFLSDEWFLKIGTAFPNRNYYAGHDLRENGVGQVVHFMADWQDNIAGCSSGLEKPTSITIGTGNLIADYFNTNFIPLLKTVSNLDVQLKPIKNTLFGEDNVTVSGLLTGQDIIAQLKEQDLGDMVLFSNRILNEDDTLTLDDMTLGQISQALEVPVRVVGDSPTEFFTAIDHG